MSSRGLHYIADDLQRRAIGEWAALGIAEIEALLAKHAAFYDWLERSNRP